MGARTGGREAALQILFAREVAGDDLGRVMTHFFRHFECPEDARAYAEECARGVCDELEALDALLRRASLNWRLERMTRVDRNILRIGAWELRHGDVPRAVVVDEAVELAKRFGSQDSAAFVNGVLDKVADLAGAR